MGFPEFAALLDHKITAYEATGEELTSAWKNRLLYGSASAPLPPPPAPLRHLGEQEVQARVVRAHVSRRESKNTADDSGCVARVVSKQGIVPKSVVANVGSGDAGADKENQGVQQNGRGKGRSKDGKPPAWNWGEVIGKVKDRPRAWTGEGGWV